MPNSIDVSKPLAAGLSHGSLTVVGTGIRSIAHMTQEAIGHIRDADAVFYSVPDGVTAAFIRDLNPSAYNLSLHYGEDKRRLVTYVQMAEVILREVRKGKRVVAVFYGHPGYFVCPARRALNIARKEGHHTEMLPGISSTDYLFSDLRIDPSVHGCQILEASDMILRGRPVVTSSHVVLLQIGSFGDVTYSAKGFIRNKREILFEHLIDLYGEDHPSYYYLGATFPGLESQIVRRPLKAYRDPAIRASVHSASTLYLPPKEVLPIKPDMAEKLGMVMPGGNATGLGDALSKQPAGDYGTFELEAVARLDREPLGGRLRQTPKALYRILSQIASNPTAAYAFRKDPKTYVSLFGGLTEAEKSALTKRSPAALHAVALQVEYGPATPSEDNGYLSRPVDKKVVALLASAEHVTLDASEQSVKTTSGALDFVLSASSSNGASQSSDVAEHDVAEHDVAEHDVAEHDVAEHDVAEHDVAEHDVAEHDVAEHDVAEHDVAEHDVAEHDVAEHDVAEHDVAEHDVAEHDVAEHDVANQDK